MAARVSEYNSKPVLCLTKTPEDKYAFTFGVQKAQLILENLDAIRTFVSAHGPRPETVEEKRDRLQKELARLGA